MSANGKYIFKIMEELTMLVSAKEMLDKAKAGHYAVGQFNINNLEWTKSVLLTAEELRSPVILGVSEGAGKYMTGFGTVAAMVKAMDEELGITVPVALHLDHGTYEGCYKCIEAGFSSIMFDGSHYPIEENIEKTKEIFSQMTIDFDIIINQSDNDNCNIHFTITGAFLSKGKISEEDFKQLVAINGASALIGIARGKIESLSSSIFNNGKIVIPFVNVIDYYKATISS